MLTGQIAAGDSKKFQAWVLQHPSVEEISLQSPGGSVRDALEIGRIIRANFLETRTETGCDSSCAFVALAGAIRHLFEIGVHRPTKASAHSETLAQAKDAYRRVEEELRSYLSEMDVPDQIVNQVFSAGPDTIRKIGLAELEKSVNGPAASVQEWLHNRCDDQIKLRRRDQIVDPYEMCISQELGAERRKKQALSIILGISPPTSR